MTHKRRVPLKWQLLGFGWLMCGLLALYTLPALWEYVDLSQMDNAWMRKFGLAAGEVVIAVWVWWHVWRRWWVTRAWCLLAATILGIALVVHASAVSKYNSAKKEAIRILPALADAQAKIAGAAAKGSQEGAGNNAARLRREGAPGATVNRALRAGGQGAAQAGIEGQKTLADAAVKIEDQARSSTFLSPEYLGGKMFVVIFSMLIGLVGLTFIVFEFGKAEEDDDADGIPNYADHDSQYYNRERAVGYWRAHNGNFPAEIDNGNTEKKA